MKERLLRKLKFTGITASDHLLQLTCFYWLNIFNVQQGLLKNLLRQTRQLKFVLMPDAGRYIPRGNLRL